MLMEGTPQIALLLLVLGLILWAWPRPFANASMEQVRRWVPVVGWTWAMCTRLIGAANPSAWPHFAARLGSDATVLERLAAIVSGDGLVLMARPDLTAGARLYDSACELSDHILRPLLACGRLRKLLCWASIAR